MRVRRRGAVGVRRPRCNHVQRVAEDVAEHDGQHLGGGAVCAEPPALHGTHALSQSVYLHDVRPRCEQVMCERGQFLHGNERLFKKGAPAAREEKEHRIIFSKMRGHGERPPGRRE